MRPSIGKILYATDMSENSRQAFYYTASLADKYSAEIVTLHVFELLSTSTQLQISGYLGAENWEKIQKENEKALMDQIRTSLMAFCEEASVELDACPIQESNVLVRKGIAMEKILETADEVDADLIVMGTHGYGAVKDALMGGTVRRVLRRSDRPVLVVPSRKKGAA